jgi:hypothetical protein
MSRDRDNLAILGARERPALPNDSPTRFDCKHEKLRSRGQSGSRRSSTRLVYDLIILMYVGIQAGFAASVNDF